MFKSEDLEVGELNIDDIRMPPGLILNDATGSVTGTPRIAGNYSMTVRASSGLGETLDRTFSIKATRSFINSGAGGSIPITFKSVDPAASVQATQGQDTDGRSAMDFVSGAPAYQVVGPGFTTVPELVGATGWTLVMRFKSSVVGVNSIATVFHAGQAGERWRLETGHHGTNRMGFRLIGNSVGLNAFSPTGVTYGSWSTVAAVIDPIRGVYSAYYDKRRGDYGLLGGTSYAMPNISAVYVRPNTVDTMSVSHLQVYSRALSLYQINDAVFQIEDAPRFLDAVQSGRLVANITSDYNADPGVAYVTGGTAATLGSHIRLVDNKEPAHGMFVYDAVVGEADWTVSFSALWTGEASALWLFMYAPKYDGGEQRGISKDGNTPFQAGDDTGLVVKFDILLNRLEVIERGSVSHFRSNVGYTKTVTGVKWDHVKIVKSGMLISVLVSSAADSSTLVSISELLNQSYETTDAVRFGFAAQTGTQGKKASFAIKNPSWNFIARPVVPTWSSSTDLGTTARGEPLSRTFQAIEAGSYVVSTPPLFPIGLSLATPSGILSGSPSTSSAYTFTIRAHSIESEGVYAERSFTLLVATRPTWTTAGALLGIAKSYASSITLSATDAGSYEHTPGVSGYLPTGMSLSSTGVLSGTPTTDGSYSFSVRAYSTSSDLIYSNRDFTIVVGTQPVWSTAPTLEGAAKGEVISSRTLSASSTGSYSLVSGSNLPAGVSLAASTGILSGTPSALGTFTFGIRATSAGSNDVYADRVFTIVVTQRPTWSTATALAGAAKGETMSSRTLSAVNASSYVLVPGSTLPLGLSLATATGILSGTPTALATSTFSIRAVSGDSPDVFADRAFTLVVASRPVWNTASQLPGTPRNVDKSIALSASDTASFALASGALPDGMLLNASTGVLSGNPYTARTWSFTIRATSASPDVFADRTFTLVVALLPAWSTASRLADTAKDEALTSRTLSAANTGSYALVSGSTLPAGLSLASATGVLGGTPTALGTFTFSIRATSGDSSDVFADRAFTLVVAQRPGWSTASALSGIARSTASSIPLVATNAGAYEHRPGEFGNLPSGMSFSSSTGVLSGTPTTDGRFEFGVRAYSTTSNDIYASQNFSICVATRPVWNTTSQLPGIARNVDKSIALSASDATSFTLVSGALPDGMLLNDSTGVLSGNPYTARTWSFTVRAISAGSSDVFADRAFTLVVALRVEWSTASGLQDTAEDEAMASRTLAAANTGSYALVSGSSLPAGLSLAVTTGILSGTPITPGAFTFAIRATSPNTSDVFADRAFTLLVATRPAWTTASAIGSVGFGQTFSFPSIATNAGSYSKTSGTTWIDVSSQGILSGTASTTTAGYTVVVRAISTTSTSVWVERTFTISVIAPPAWTTGSALSDYELGTLANINLAATRATSYLATSGPGSWVRSFDVFSHRDDFGVSADKKSTELYWRRDSKDGNAAWAALNTAPSFNRLYNDVTKRVFAIIPGTFSGANDTYWKINIGTFTKTDMDTMPFSGNKQNQYHTWFMYNSPYASEVDQPDIYLPPGMTLNASTGAIRGTCAAPAANTFTIRAVDDTAQNAFTDREFTTAVAIRPVWDPVTLTRAVGTRKAFSFSNTASNAGSYTLADGRVWMSLSATGELTGTTPANLATYDAVVRAISTTSTAIWADRTFKVSVIAQPVWSTGAGLPDRAVGDSGLYHGANEPASSYDRFVATTSTPNTTVSFFVLSGSFPSGTTLTSDGIHNGVNDAAGTFTFTLRAFIPEASNAFVDRTFTSLVATRPTWVTPESLGKVGSGSAFTFTSVASDAGSYSKRSGASWVDVSSAGVLTGTADTALAGYTVVVRATSTTSAAVFAERTFTIETIAQPVWNNFVISDRAVGATYESFDTQASTSTAGTTLSFLKVDGSLPNGTTLEASGNLSGAANAAGTFTFTVRAFIPEAQNAFADKIFTSLVATRPTWITSGSIGKVGSGGDFSFASVASYSGSYSKVSGTSWIVVSSAGVLTGTASTSVAGYTVVVRAISTTSTEIFAERTFTINVIANPQWNNYVFLDRAVGSTYGSFATQVLVASGTTLSFSQLSGTLPSGTTLAENGGHNGTTNAAGTFTFSVRVSIVGAQNSYADKTWTAIVATTPTWVTSDRLGNIALSRESSIALLASDAGSYYTGDLPGFTTGSLPVSMVFSTTGVLSGTPSVARLHNFRVRAYSILSNEVYADRVFEISVVPPPAWTTTEVLPDYELGTPANIDLAATRATSYSVVSGPGAWMRTFEVSFHRDDLGVTSDGKRADLYWNKGNRFDGDAFWEAVTTAPSFNRLYNNVTKACVCNRSRTSRQWQFIVLLDQDCVAHKKRYGIKAIFGGKTQSNSYMVCVQQYVRGRGGPARYIHATRYDAERKHGCYSRDMCGSGSEHVHD